ncbi:MAG: hypothetical protein ABS55_05705 [Lautropia sp. SCN 70-15]|nr:MAG: hypothetical protein ABS55_05705 [Lautropia sp. SCN 70-15]
MQGSQVGLTLILGGLALCALAAAIVRTSTSGVFFWLLVLSSIVVLGVRRYTAPLCNAGVGGMYAVLWLAVLILLGLNIGSVVAFDLRASAASWWPLLAIPVIAALPLRRDAGLWILAHAAIFTNLLALALALLLLYSPDVVSKIVTVNSILFGQVTVSLSLLCALALSRADFPCGRIALLAAMLSGLVATVMVGYRGGLLAVPLFAACLLQAAPMKQRGLGALSLLAVLVVSIAVIWTPMYGRLAAVIEETIAFSHGVVGYSSVGTRLALWDIAIDAFLAHPLFGVGAGRFGAEMRSLADAGALPRDLGVFDHAHNTYLNVAAEYGVIGILAFAAALTLVFRSATLRERREFGVVAYVIGCWMIFALTNDVLAHQSSMRVMSMMIGFVLADVAAERRQDRRWLGLRRPFASQLVDQSTTTASRIQKESDS